MTLEIESNGFAGWAGWEYGVNCDVINDIDCASIASNSVVGFGEGIVVDIIDAEIVVAIF